MNARALIALGFVGAGMLLASRAAAAAPGAWSTAGDDANGIPGGSSANYSGGEIFGGVGLEYLGELASDAFGGALDFANELTGGILPVSSSTKWARAAELPENQLYIVALRDTEAARGIPPNLLVRLAWQESRFNPQAYNAGSGASGIMQIVPRWHPEVNPWDAVSAIAYGGSYLAQMFRQFGTWELALKAYNWGPGNVAKWLQGQATEPSETRNYSRQILADVRALTGQVIA